MSDTLNDRAARAFEKIHGWTSVGDLDKDFVSVSKATKKRMIFDNIDSWLAINHPRISFITFLVVVIDIVINISK